MIKKMVCYTIIILILQAQLLTFSVFADEPEEELNSQTEKTYTNITNQYSDEMRQTLSDYLCRFSACYTTDFESTDGGKVVFNNNWTDKMTEVIWWQYLAYSERDRNRPNAPIHGNTKTVTPDALQNCVRNTFGITSTPNTVVYAADSYYIDHTDGNFHPPQQQPTKDMWTWAPESCKIQYIVKLDDGTYLVHFIPEYLEISNGKHNGSLYYAKLKDGATSSGYIATEIGIVSALDDKFIKMGFLEDSKNGAQTLSNIKMMYNETKDFSSVEEYKKHLEDVFWQLGDNSPNGPAINNIAAYISSACLRNSKIEFTANDNIVTIDLESIKDSASAAVRTSDALWDNVNDKGIENNKKIVVPIQIVVENLNENKAPKIIFDRSLIEDDLGISYMRILLGDNSHSIIMDKATCNRIIEEYGTFSIEMGMSISGGYIINFFDSENNQIDKLPIKVNFSIPATDVYDSVYTTSDGRDFNIGGIYDDGNSALEFKINTSGIYKVKNNTPNISDISELDQALQEQIRFLVSKDYFAITGTRFRPYDAYTNFDASRAISGILFTVDTDARAKYNDIDEADPQSMYVASIEEAGIKLNSEQGGLRFNGNYAVGLQDTYNLSLELLKDYKEYFVPDLGSNKDRPYSSIYLNNPDLQYIEEDTLENIALGTREGIINDGMALAASQNRINRSESAEFLYRYFMRMCEVSPTVFDAGEDGYRSNSVFYNPLTTMTFETPTIVYIYLGCFVVGIIFSILLLLMQKKHKIVNETAADAGEDDEYWNEY